MYEHEINGHGNGDADLMIVTDYARKFDSTTRKCISGYYQIKFRDFLADAAYKIDQCYLTSVIKHYIEGCGTRGWKTDKSKLEQFYAEHFTNLEYFIEELIKEINITKPLIIIASGEYALQVLTGKSGITKWRGSVLPLNPNLQDKLRYESSIKVVPTLHPQDIQIDESNTFLIRIDVEKAVEFLFKPNTPIDDFQLHVAHSASDFIRFRSQYPETPVEMSYDIESHHGFITCVGVSYDGIQAISIPLIADEKISIVDKARLMVLVDRDLRNENIRKINQNLFFDKRISQKFGFVMNNTYWDTMLAAQVITQDFPKRLDFLTSIHTSLSFYKDEGREWNPKKHQSEQFYLYNAKDAIAAFRVKQAQYKELQELELLNFFEDFIMRLAALYYDNDSTGFLISKEKQAELTAKYEGFLHLKLLEVKAIAGKDININSPDQIGNFLKENNFPAFYHATPKGILKVNTDINNLKKMKTLSKDKWSKCKLLYDRATRFLDLVLLARRVNGIIEHINVGVHPNGRVYTSANLAGTSSGRTSGNKSADFDYIWEKDKLKKRQLGQSFQTVTKHGYIIEEDEDIEDIGETIIGKDIRDMYLADKGYCIVEVDGSQAEARVVDVLSEDWKALEEYGKIDKHCKVAAEIFTDYSYEDLVRLSKKEKTSEGLYMRYIGKRGKHANNLGIGAFMLALNANVTERFAAEILNKLDKAYPKTRRIFHAQVEEMVRSTRQLWNPFGRKRFFFKKIDNHYIKVAYSWLPQSIVSDNTKRAMLEINESADRDKFWFIVENHDSFTAMVKHKYLREFCTISKKALERPIDMRLCCLQRDYDLVIPAEFTIGRKTWGNMKEVKMVKKINALIA